jgi:hypothetical protein
VKSTGSWGKSPTWLGQITQLVGANDSKRNKYFLAGGKAVGNKLLKINDNNRYSHHRSFRRTYYSYSRDIDRQVCVNQTERLSKGLKNEMFLS